MKNFQNHLNQTVFNILQYLNQIEMNNDDNLFLRDDILKNLGIRSLFPTEISYRYDIGSSARCMLEKENNEKVLLPIEKIQEDLNMNARKNSNLKLDDKDIKISEVQLIMLLFIIFNAYYWIYFL